MSGIDLGSVYAAIGVADDIINLVKGIKDPHVASTLEKHADAITQELEQYTGTTLASLRDQRDALSADTHRIIKEEIAKTPIS